MWRDDRDPARIRESQTPSEASKSPKPPREDEHTELKELQHTPSLSHQHQSCQELLELLFFFLARLGFPRCRKGNIERTTPRPGTGRKIFQGMLHTWVCITGWGRGSELLWEWGKVPAYAVCLCKVRKRVCILLGKGKFYWSK